MEARECAEMVDQKRDADDQFGVCILIRASDAKLCAPFQPNKIETRKKTPLLNILVAH